MLSIRLKTLRRQHGKTQQDIASSLGITRQGYAKYENNLGEPDNSSLVKLADYFNTSVDYLLGRIEFPQVSTKTEGINTNKAFSNDQELISFYNELLGSDERLIRKLRNIWEVIKDESS